MAGSYEFVKHCLFGSERKPPPPPKKNENTVEPLAGPWGETQHYNLKNNLYDFDLMDFIFALNDLYL